MTKILLGKYIAYMNEQDLWLPLYERAKHFYIIGKSGSGKSTLIFNMLLSDIALGRGACLFDPHGDLAASILEHIPRHRTRDVVYLNLADPDFVVAWNPLSVSAFLPVATIAFTLTSAMKHIWRESWGPRMEYILTNCFFALAEQGETIMALPRLLSDEQYRAKLAAKIQDPKVKHFFEVEFAGLDEKQRVEFVAPIQNKIGQLLTHEAVRHMFCVKSSKIDLRYMMDNKRILIVNLAKGRIGEEPANLFGSVLLSLLTATAMSRSDIAEETREPFMLYVDEFQNFSTDSFASALSEVRKYGLYLTLANQFMDQLNPAVRSAVFGNVQSKVLFAVGASDAEALKLETRPYPETYLLDLGTGKGLFCNGSGEAKQFTALAPIDSRKFKNKRTGHPMARTGRAHVIIAESRRKFSIAKQKVEEFVQKALSPRGEKKMLHYKR